MTGLLPNTVHFRSVIFMDYFNSQKVKWSKSKSDYEWKRE